MTLFKAAGWGIRAEAILEGLKYIFHGIKNATSQLRYRNLKSASQ